MRILTLVGLSGSGKTTVGALLAARLGARLVDLDREVEAHAGAEIATIFDKDGESEFRRLETQALQRTLRGVGPAELVVLATGGGAPCGQGVMDRLRAEGLVVWLRVSPREAALRLADARDRPLLSAAGPAAAGATAGSETEERVEGVMRTLAGQLIVRDIVYGRAHEWVDVDELDVEDVADAIEVLVLEHLGRGADDGPELTLQVDLGERSYPIHLVEELPGERVASEALRIRGAGAAGSAVLVVTDTNVRALYCEGVREALREAGFRVDVAEVPAGEATKSLSTVSGLVDRALAFGLGRRDLVVALGGGVVGDLAGFLAAVLLRGVRFLQVPTTLLAQVDSAVGGKTGVNHPMGKNLIGAFWQPSSVVASAAVLRTLPERERRCGLAEALKHGLLADAALTAWIEERADALRALEPGPTLALVQACCRIKAAVVADDEREAGARQVLNLGHTFGHAYERALGYGQLTHGEAVALGMVLATRLSERLSVAPCGLERRVRELLDALGLPSDPEAAGLPAPTTLLTLARSDKKADGDSVAFVLPTAMGAVTIQTLAFATIAEALSEGPAS